MSKIVVEIQSPSMVISLSVEHLLMDVTNIDSVGMITAESSSSCLMVSMLLVL